MSGRRPRQGLAWMAMLAGMSLAGMAPAVAPAAEIVAPAGKVLTDTLVLAQISEAIKQRDYATEVAGFETLAKHWPESLRKLPPQATRQVSDALRALPDRTLQSRFLEALLAAGYVEDLETEPSWLWAELALAQWESGDHRAALATAKHITNPWTLAGMVADKRYDGLLAAVGRPPNVPGALNAEISRLQKYATTHPYNLKPKVTLASLLSKAGRSAEALGMLDEALSKMDAATPGTRLYADQAEQYVWMLDIKSGVLRDLGRNDECVATMERAAKSTEQGRPNVSQRINLAELYNDFGRPRDALAALEGMGRASAFGGMQMNMEKYRAAVQLDDAAARDEAFAYLEEHQKDAARTWERALLLANRADEAEPLLLKRLEDPAQRLQLLSRVQDWVQGPTTPVVAAERASWEALLARPALHAAIAQAGSIRKYAIQG